MPKRYELPDLRPRDLVRLTNPEGGESLMYLNAQGRGHWVHFRDSRTLGRLTRPGAGWDLRDHEGNYTELGRLRDVDEHIVADAERWPELEASLRAAGPLTSPKIGDVLTREQVAALPAGAVTQDLDTPGGYVEQWNGEGRGRVVGVTSRRLGEELDDEWYECPRPARLVALGTPLDDRRAVYHALADQGFKPAVEALAGELRPSEPVQVSATGTMVQVGDMVETTQEALTALPGGAVVYLWDPDGWKNVARRTENGFRWVSGDSTATPWSVLGRRAVVIALECHDRNSAVKARDAFLARLFKGQDPAAAALAAMIEARIATDVKAALDQVSDAGLNDQTISAVAGAVASAHSSLQAFDGQSWVKVQGFAADAYALTAPRQVAVGDEIYIDAAPVGAVVTDEQGGPTTVWCVVGPKAARPVNVISPLASQLPRSRIAPRRLGRVVALGAPVHHNRQALLHHLAEAGYEPARARLAAQAKAVKNALDRAREELLDEPAAIEYRQAMSEIKASMKLDLLTETLQIKVPRLPGETDNAYAARAGALVKPQTAAPIPTPNLADALTLAAEPTWLERVAEALKPVAAELAAEAKAQTRQAIALGGVEVARAAAHRGLAAAVDALAPQHATKVVQVTQHPVTRWLENAALFLGARAAGKPALAQVGLREVVKAPMEGAAGLLVQAASQVVGAVKGALVAADEAARVEQMTERPEAAQVSAGEA